MSYQAKEDNIYAVGTFITAKEAPVVTLEIPRYYQRIYYCSIVDNDTDKLKAYLGRELIAPVQGWNQMMLRVLQAIKRKHKAIVFALKYILKPLEFEKFDVFQDRASVNYFRNQSVYYV